MDPTQKLALVVAEIAELLAASPKPEGATAKIFQNLKAQEAKLELQILKQGGEAELQQAKLSAAAAAQNAKQQGTLETIVARGREQRRAAANKAAQPAKTRRFEARQARDEIRRVIGPNRPLEIRRGVVPRETIAGVLSGLRAIGTPEARSEAGKIRAARAALASKEQQERFARLNPTGSIRKPVPKGTELLAPGDIRQLKQSGAQAKRAISTLAESAKAAEIPLGLFGKLFKSRAGVGAAVALPLLAALAFKGDGGGGGGPGQGELPPALQAQLAIEQIRAQGAAPNTGKTLVDLSRLARLLQTLQQMQGAAQVPQPSLF